MKKYGIRQQKTKLENVLLGDKNKMISNIYKILLESHTADEAVKEQMIKWSINCNIGIMTEQSEYLWRKSIKISFHISRKLFQNDLSLDYDTKEIGQNK